MNSLAFLAGPLYALSQRLEPFVSDKGGMFITLEGLDHDGAASALTWHLVASRNLGPYIPCGAAVALVRKLAREGTLPAGATPCMGLLSTSEYLEALAGFDCVIIAPCSTAP
ncbi:MAG: hypothetical protein ACRYGK_05930 [Janthinobacterium lividum]